MEKSVLRLFLLHVFSFLLKGEAYTLPYERNGAECRNMTSEYSPTGLNLCCSICRPGFRLSKECTASSDTVCEECKEGTYSDTMNYHPNCFRCNMCNPNKNLVPTKNCTRVSNSHCECKPGWYCASQFGSAPCSQCRKRTVCPPGKGTRSPESLRCVDCVEGTFSNETSSMACKPHTQCEAEGRAVLHRGNATHDTVCKPAATPHEPPTTIAQITPTRSKSPPRSLSNFSTETVLRTTAKDKPTLNPDNTVSYSVIGCVGAVVILLAVLLTTFIIRHRKGLRKLPVKEVTQKPGQAPFSKRESEHLLEDSKTSSSSASSASSTPDSHSQSTGASQDNIHSEQSLVSSPCVNFSITATINCQLSQPQGSCSIPIPSPTQPQPQLLTQPQPEPETETHPVPVHSDLPLSQEEQLRVSCEEENSKDVLQSLQESGMTVY